MLSTLTTFSTFEQIATIFLNDLKSIEPNAFYHCGIATIASQ